MARPTTRIHGAADAVLIALFLALLFLPLADDLLGLDPAPPLDENRTLAACPRAPSSAQELAAFAAPFEAYFNDHFGFRNSLLRLHSLATVYAFGVSPTPMVAIGKEGWLYLAKEELDYQRADRPYSAQELATWQHTLEVRRDWLAARGCRYLVVVVPNKSTIYPEHLPDSARRIGKTTRLDQLLEHLRSHSDVDVLDLRPVLLEAKGSEPLYFQTDSHWNTLGAFVAYQEIVRRLGRWFPELEPLSRSSFRTRLTPSTTKDLGAMVGADALFPETLVEFKAIAPRRAAKAEVEIPGGLSQPPLRDRLYATEIDDPSLPRAVLFCDSFSTFFSVFLSEHFRRIVRFRSSYASDPSTLFEPAMVELERPEVVISEFAERFLVRAPPEDPGLLTPR